MTERPRGETFYTVCDIAHYLYVSERQVRRWIELRRLIAHRFGTSVRVAEPDLRDFLAARRDGHRDFAA